jgi:hypothetical protein
VNEREIVKLSSTYIPFAHWQMVSLFGLERTLL